jgi:peptidoglycan/xylan/chitin deacetylase (PgdA/CDA1 family)
MKQTARVVDSVFPAALGVTVLLYHRVGGRAPIEMDLPASLFDEQMSALSATRRVLTLDDALDELQTPPAGRVPTTEGVVVTFDDGTVDFVEDALPVLERYRIPATMFVATDYIESGRSFPNDGRPTSWAALKDACSTGLVTIGSHTDTHALLDRLPRQAVQVELERSIERIRGRLDQPVDHFAYPKAVAPTGAADTEVRRRFRTASLAGTRPNRPGATDPFRLRRSPIQRSDGMTWFEQKVDGGLWFEDVARRTLNRVRYRGRTT